LSAGEGGLLLPTQNDMAADELETTQVRPAHPREKLTYSATDDRSVRVESRAPQRYRLIGLGQGVTDGLSMLLALLGSYVIRFDFPIPTGYLVVMATMPLLWVVTFRSFSLHSPQLLSAWEEFSRVIAASSVGMVLVIMTSFWSKASLSRIWVGLTWVLVLLLELMTRRFWRWLTHKGKEDGRLSLRTLIVGTQGEALRLAAALDRPASGFKPVGFISTHSRASDDQRPVVGGLDDLVSSLHDYGVDCLFVAESDLKHAQLMEIAQAARQQEVEVRFTAHLPEILSPRLSVQPIGGIMTLAVKPVRLSRGQAMLKRGFDVVLSGSALLVAAPLLVAIALAVKVSSGGPVLFRQRRVTKGGHIFKMYKFRTMTLDSDRFTDERDIDTTTPFFKLGPEDPRLTRVGRFLRKYSLDELPQLLNVLAGQMSLVGPRPLPADQVAANLELLGPRHEVPAGVTGWWQIQGRSQIEDPAEAVRMDLFYIENWSLALDLYVIFKTFGAVLVKRGAF
jgi:exopolysaccharide biosynthesis polyprenyl glycosylphosphotransferase